MKGVVRGASLVGDPDPKTIEMARGFSVVTPPRDVPPVHRAGIPPPPQPISFLPASILRVIDVEFEEVLKKVLEDGPEGTSKEWMNDIQSEYGRVPLIFRRMAERPEVLISHLLYKGTVISTSSIEPKYVELISLAVGAALKCPHCVEYHMQSAMRKGATREEILEVILISGMLANSAILASAYRIIDTVESCAACDVNGLNGKVTAKKAPAETKPKGRRSKRTAPAL